MKRIAFAQLVELVGGDLELVTTIIREEIISEDERGYAIRDVDRVLTARTLVRELDIDWSGVGLILQLREQLAEARWELAMAKSRDPREPATRMTARRPASRDDPDGSENGSSS